jgi:hypothetical protein
MIENLDFSFIGKNTNLKGDFHFEAPTKKELTPPYSSVYMYSLFYHSSPIWEERITLLTFLLVYIFVLFFICVYPVYLWLIFLLLNYLLMGLYLLNSYYYKLMDYTEYLKITYIKRCEFMEKDLQEEMKKNMQKS